MSGAEVFGIFFAHMVGDYLIQTHHMATEKTKRWWPAIVHGVTYTIPYLFVTQSPLALLVIASTHIVLDRYRLPKYFIWAKNQIAPRKYRFSWESAKNNGGYPEETPVWLSTWLLILTDNIIHIGINAAAVVWL